MKTYIQIGTNDGNDEFKKRIEQLKNKSNVYLIEPNSDLISKIEENYKSLKEIHNVFILNVGIVSHKGINELYTDLNYSGFSSVINRKSHNLSSKIQFTPLTFQELCDTNNISNIELLYIDTEGYDYTILNSIDFKTVNIKKIICELWPYDIDSDDNILTGPTFFNNVIKLKMENNNYQINLIKIENMDSYDFTKI